MRTLALSCLLLAAPAAGPALAGSPLPVPAADDPEEGAADAEEEDDEAEGKDDEAEGEDDEAEGEGDDAEGEGDATDEDADDDEASEEDAEAKAEAAEALWEQAREAHGAGDVDAARTAYQSLVDDHEDSEHHAKAEAGLKALDAIGHDLTDHEIKWWVTGDEAAWAEGAQLALFLETFCDKCISEADTITGHVEAFRARGGEVVVFTRLQRATRKGDWKKYFRKTAGFEAPVGYSPKLMWEDAGIVDGPPGVVVMKDGVVTWAGDLALLDEPAFASVD